VQSSHNQIELKIKKSPKGKIFFADDFVKFGSSDNVRKILSRLEKEGLLERLAQGIYLVPKKDELLGTLYPTTEEIAKEIAKRDKARIAPTGSLALYQLGITTQIPLKAVYLTDAAQRVIAIGNRTIQFKKTTPRNLAIKDHLLMLITQALKEIGYQKVTDLQIQKLKPFMLQLDVEILKSQLKFAPVWVQKIINEVRN
jgi:predicted transcriptional regulator of viral defense system